MLVPLIPIISYGIEPVYAMYLIFLPLLRRMEPLAGASMLKTSLLINKLTCVLGNAM